MHEVLPECIDRLARIEQNLVNMQDNHLPHIYEELKGLHDDIKKTQNFIVTQIIAFGILAIGALVQIILL
jgi:uncharacterized protein (UPF0335 family)